MESNNDEERQIHQNDLRNNDERRMDGGHPEQPWGNNINWGGARQGGVGHEFGEADDHRFEHGFKEGFTRAREIFWRDFMRKAGDARLMGQQLVDSAGGATPQSEAMFMMEATYRSVADSIAKSHTLYPGALPADLDINDESINIRFRALFNY